MRNKFTDSEKAILTTLLYSDIFSFPLTKDELWKFLISEKKISRDAFEKGLHSLKNIVFQDGYYCLSGKEAVIAKRKQHSAEVGKKTQLARLVAEKLAEIPSILFIGISGGLAVGNVTKDDDIDLVIITKKNSLFVSRLFVLLTLQRLGMRRSRNQRNTADTICTNLFFDETAFSWFGKNQDVYTAREIAQMVPLFEREGMYKKFLLSNKWIRGFLPNVVYLSSPTRSGTHTIDSRLRGNDKNKSQNDGIWSNFLINPLFESLSRSFQMTIMKGHQTNEIVTKHILAFHPNDYRAKTLRQLRLKMRQFGLLTKI